MLPLALFDATDIACNKSSAFGNAFASHHTLAYCCSLADLRLLVGHMYQLFISYPTKVTCLARLPHL